MSRLSHFDDRGGARMVDVGGKDVTVRKARASGTVRMLPQTLSLIREGKAAKGDVLAVARLVGITAAKRTAEWIPLAHCVPLDAVELAFDFPGEDELAIVAEARATARTGVEMEALVAVSAAALTVYDMCKSADRGMVVEQIRLEEKSGGKSGRYVRQTS